MGFQLLGFYCSLRPKNIHVYTLFEDMDPHGTLLKPHRALLERSKNRIKEPAGGTWIHEANLTPRGLGFRVQGLGFRVQGLGFRVQGLGFRVQGSATTPYSHPPHSSSTAEGGGGVGGGGGGPTTETVAIPDQTVLSCSRATFWRSLAG